MRQKLRKTRIRHIYVLPFLKNFNDLIAFCLHKFLQFSLDHAALNCQAVQIRENVNNVNSCSNSIEYVDCQAIVH